MEIYNVPTEKLDEAFRKINTYIEEKYKEDIFETVSKKLGIPKETLEGKNFNDVLKMLADKWEDV